MLLLLVQFEYTVYAQTGWGTFRHKTWATTNFNKSIFLFYPKAYFFTSVTESVSCKTCRRHRLLLGLKNKVSVTVWRTVRQEDKDVLVVMVI